MIARLWDGTKACGRFIDWLFGWLFSLNLICWAAAWAVGSVHAGRFLDLAEVLEVLNEWAVRLGLN